MALNSKHSARGRYGKPAGWWLIGGLIIAGMAADPIMADSAGQMPPIYDPSVLLPANGGDGSQGFVLNGAQTMDRLGTSVALGGDVTGNGRDDLLAGATLFGGFLSPEGALVLIEGQSVVPMTDQGLEFNDLLDGNIDPAPGWVSYIPDTPIQLGRRVRYLGDLDGDGIGDLGIAASNTVSGENFAGEIFIVYGGDGMPDVLADLSQLFPENGGDGSKGFIINGLPDGELIGRDFFGDHDLTGNGHTDLVIHARSYYEESRGRGRSFVLFGREGRSFPPLIDYDDLLSLEPPDGLRIVPPDPEAPITSPDPGFANVRMVNDLNGDGLDELLLCRSVSQYFDGDLDGECYLVFGRSGPELFPAQLDLGELLERNGGDGSSGVVIRGSEHQECLGASLFGGITTDSDQVDSIGDLDRDGFNDVLIGTAGCTIPGKAYVIYGQAEWPAELHLGDPDSGGELQPRMMRIHPPAPVSATFGFAQGVGGIGDFNANGYPDLAVFSTATPPLDRTGTFVIYGGPDLPTDFHTADLYPENGGDGSRGFLIRDFPGEELLGTALSSGDFNGDGAPDLALGGRASDPNGLSNAGRAVVLYGTPPLTPLQVPAISVRGLVVLAGAMLLILLLAGRRRLY